MFDRHTASQPASQPADLAKPKRSNLAPHHRNHSTQTIVACTTQIVYNENLLSIQIDRSIDRSIVCLIVRSFDRSIDCWFKCARSLSHTTHTPHTHTHANANADTHMLRRKLNGYRDGHWGLGEKGRALRLKNIWFVSIAANSFK